MDVGTHVGMDIWVILSYILLARSAIWMGWLFAFHDLIVSKLLEKVGRSYGFEEARSVGIILEFWEVIGAVPWYFATFLGVIPVFVWMFGSQMLFHICLAVLGVTATIAGAVCSYKVKKAFAKDIRFFIRDILLPCVGMWKIVYDDSAFQGFNRIPAEEMEQFIDKLQK